MVTFEDNPVAHVKTEFGFDVLEVAKGSFAPDAYPDFIGFEVAQSLLDRAFEETYGAKLSTILDDEARAIGSYRHSVSDVIPKATKVAWQLKKDDTQKDLPGITRDRFLYNLSRASYEKRWGKNYRRPNAGEKVLASFFRLIPKIGPLEILTFRTPTPETEKMFEASFNATLDHYRSLLTELGAIGKVMLPNDNFDVGVRTAPGECRLNDETYPHTPFIQASWERFWGEPLLIAGSANGTILSAWVFLPRIPFRSGKATDPIRGTGRRWRVGRHWFVIGVIDSCS